MNTYMHSFTISFLLAVTMLLAPAYAQPDNGAQRVIQKGDTLYSIIRKELPGKKITPALLRQIVANNPNAFVSADPGQLIVGATLHFGNKNEPAPVIAKPVKPQPIQNNTAQRKTPRTQVAQKAQPAKKQRPDSNNSIGRVISSIGDVTAVDTSGKTRPLENGAKVYKGDTLQTGKNAHGQVRFIDGALVALRTETRFRINEYNYRNIKDISGKSTFELIKGGFRTITGAIGKLRKRNYRVVTPVATIGIRGTHYGLRLCEAASCNSGKKGNQSLKAGLYGGVVDGAISINNDSGEHTFSNDQYFHIASANVAPKGLIKPPGIIFDGVELQAKRIKQQQKADAKSPQKQQAVKQKMQAVKKQLQRGLAGNPFAEQIIGNNIGGNAVGLAQPEFNVGDDTGTNTGGVSQSNLQPAPPGSNLSFSFISVEIDPGTGMPIPLSVSDTSASVTADGTPNNLIFLSDVGGPMDLPVAASQIDMGEEKSLLLNNAVINEVGFNPNAGVLWGRWDGEFSVDDGSTPIAPLGSLHFMYSENITSFAELQNLGPLGSSVIYSPVPGAGTLPTDHRNTVGNYLSAQMTVDFLTQTISNYQIDTQHAGGEAYNGSLFTLVTFAELAQGDSLPLQGFCSGGECMSGISLGGSANIIFVNKDGMPAGGAMSTFTLTGQGGMGLVGSTGGLLFTR